VSNPSEPALASRLASFALLTSPMMASGRLVLVTGGNQGIGLEIARQLGSMPNIRCLLTSRDAAKGEAAAKALREQGAANVEFHQLDITDPASVTAMAHEIKHHRGGRLDGEAPTPP
jgi:(+)-neomenthol dehydrogenase